MEVKIILKFADVTVELTPQELKELIEVAKTMNSENYIPYLPYTFPANPFWYQPYYYTTSSIKGIATT